MSASFECAVQFRSCVAVNSQHRVSCLLRKEQSGRRRRAAGRWRVGGGQAGGGRAPAPAAPKNCIPM